jgi:hypothetical protein
MSEIRNRLKELNPDLFSMRQPSIEHEVTIIGRRDKDSKSINYLLKTKPNAQAIAAKVKATQFFHAAYKPVGTIKVEADGKRSFSGPKKARVGNVFQPTQPDLFQYIRESIYEKEMKEDENGKPLLSMLPEGKTWVKAGFDGANRPQIKLRDTVYGNRIVFYTDLYVPHNVDPETGESNALTANTRNPKTGKYEPKEVVMGVYEFFADDDDMDRLLEVCTRLWQKNVEPWITEKTVTTTTKGSEVKTTIKEAEVTGMEDFIIDEFGNAIDDTGDIIYSKKQLAAQGITAEEGETVKLKRAS